MQCARGVCCVEGTAAIGVAGSHEGNKLIQRTARGMEVFAGTVAAIGGIALVGVALVTTVSIIGRAFLEYGLRPIPGDVEIVQAVCAFVVCCFLPWAQLKRGHASVNVITDFFGDRVNLFIDLVGDILLFLTAAFVTWRLFYGLEDKLAYGETTFILRFPLWWPYLACFIALIPWIITAAWCVLASAAALRRGEHHDHWGQSVE